MRGDRTFDSFSNAWQQKASSVVFLPREQSRSRAEQKVWFLRDSYSKPARNYEDERDERRSASREDTREPRSGSPTYCGGSELHDRYIAIDSQSFDDDVDIDTSQSNSSQSISSSFESDHKFNEHNFFPNKCFEYNGLMEKGGPTFVAQAAIGLSICFGLDMCIG
mmetsp:Transcript_25466/g.36501  ORF Transcript_25466/g.36501 Transcript_25466/m.36501 type:complete len:165 (-) Transcript_25466:33-527(-)